MTSKSEIINRLKKGNNRFINDQLTNKNRDSERRSKLLSKQDPYAVVISCSDSRVVPEIIFDTGIGELFVIRNAGNIGNTTTIASVEYAVSVLDIKVIIVLSHENCGAITSAVNENIISDNIKHIIEHVKPAIENSNNEEDVNEIAKINAVETVNDLTNKSSIIKKSILNGTLEIFPAYYQLESGKVEFI